MMTQNKRMKQLTSLLLLVCMLFTCVPAMAAGIKITAHPVEQTVAAKGSVSFKVGATGYSTITWHMVSPDGTEDITAKEIPTRFKGCAFEGSKTNKLTIKHVSSEMHGWKIYASFSNKRGDVEQTNPAPLWIKGMELPEQPTAMEVAEEVQSGVYGGSSITVVGCTITKGNTKGLTNLNFSGSVNVKIVANKTPAYWVINGTRFDFKPVPKTITITGLSRSVSIEAVMKGKKATTLVSADEIQAMRTGATLTVSAGKGAQMCHVNSSHLGKGGWFRTFDFTNDFQNKATKRTESGGRVTVRVKGVAPEGKGIAGYTFMGATWSFGAAVSQFLVTNLRESMRFDATYYDLSLVTLTCVNCTFYGGGYTDATTGTLYEGTTVTVVGNTGLMGSWSGLKETTIRKSNQLTFTIHRSGLIKWTPAY